MQAIPYKDAVTHKVDLGAYMTNEEYLNGAKEAMKSALKFLAIEAPNRPTKQCVDQAIAEMDDVIDNMFFKAFKLDDNLMGDYDDAPKDLSDIREHSGSI